MSDSEFELEFSEDETEQQNALEEAHVLIKKEQDRAREEQQLESVLSERRLVSIRESYQRYLCFQRLEEINLFALGLLKEQLGVTAISVDSVMCTFELGCTLDLTKLVQYVPNATLKRSKRTHLGVDLHHPRTHLGITSSGSVSIMGAKSVSEAYLAARRLACIVSTHLNPAAKIVDFTPGNIVLQIKYQETIDLVEVERGLKKEGFECSKSSGWSCIALKFSNKYLDLVQPEAPVPIYDQSQLYHDDSGMGTLTGGYTGVKQDFKLETGESSILPPNQLGSEVGLVKEEMGALGQTGLSQGGNQNDQNGQNYGQNYENYGQNGQNQALFLPPAAPTPYPPEFTYSFATKIFGSGSIMIMGLKSLAMGVLACKILCGLIKKHNHKYTWTQTMDFGQFRSRNVNIADAVERGMANKVEGGLGGGRESQRLKKQRVNDGTAKKLYYNDDESEFDDEESDLD